MPAATIAAEPRRVGFWLGEFWLEEGGALEVGIVADASIKRATLPTLLFCPAWS
jgi:hypothetical protein